MKSKHVVALSTCLIALLVMSGCVKPLSQNVYNEDEVGKGTAVSFGTVVSSREVDINGKTTGGGALLGGAAGAGVGSVIGNGGGNAVAIAGGVIAGAIAGELAEQAAANHKAIEYVVVLESGVTMTIVQNMDKNSLPFANGSRVIVQNTGGFQRVLPADQLPTQINRPQGIKIVDPPK